MSIFYLLPPRPYLGERFACYLQGLFPGLQWDSAVWANLADGLAAAATCHPDVYVVYREELPEGDEPGRALADGFGAESGDEVIELRVADRPGELTVRRWRVGASAAA
ncbi:MAG TPA: hypothetical protein VKA46_27485 [Gemmataceae bacterium]|nr:hypothetical protein [Gemmataceae bacterium]